MTPPDPSAQDIQASYRQALSLQQAGRIREAAGIYAAILKQRPLAEPMYQLGQIARAEGRAAEAAKWFRKALKLKPKEPALWQALSSVTPVKERGKLQRQAQAAGVALPTPVSDWMAKADALAGAGRIAEATKAYRAAIKAGAPRISVLVAMSERFRLAHDMTAALSAAEEALRHAPNDPAALIARALVRLETGAAEASLADLRRAVEVAPYNAVAWNLLMTGAKQKPGAPDVARLEELLAKGGSDPDAVRKMSFALAKALEDQGRHEEVFAHLDRANRLTARKYPYGFEADLTRARQLVASWQPVEGGFDGAAPIFVTGLPRSGTTLVETILSRHGAVTAGGELGVFRDTITPAVDAAIRGEMPDGTGWHAAGQAYDRAARQKAGAAEGQRLTDKSISTFSMIGHVLNALPRAKFVVLERDRRDVGLSIYKNLFPDGLHRYSNDLSDLGHYIRLFDACVAAWQRRVPGAIHIIDYARLTEDPEPEVRALLDFCGLDWDPACLSPEKSDRSVRTLSFVQVRQPIYRSSVAAWRRYETELQPLIAALDAASFDLG